MSRYTINETDLVCTVGMDFTFQLWVTDHRGEALRMDRPAKMTVRDNLGQILFETDSGEDADGNDVLTDALVLTSPENGVMQVTIPRSMTKHWSPNSACTWDAWATINDGGATTFFPEGQQIPVARGRFIIRGRTTIMEAEQI